jgi:uncharacterized protein involved in outer membrane biogenesis
MRKTLLIVTGLLLLILAVMATAPFLFKDRILAYVRTSANRHVRAKLDFKDLDLSLFRSFPNLSAGIDGLVVMEAPGFSGDTLLSARRIDLVIDFMKVIKGDYQVNAILVESPRIKAKVNKQGLANWDVLIADSAASGPEQSDPLALDIHRYAVSDGYVFYADETMDFVTEINGLKHEGKARLDGGHIKLNTVTEAVAVNVSYEHIPYLRQVAANIRSDISIESETSTYRFNQTSIRLNELDIMTNGYFQMPDDSTYRMDISFSSPSRDFRHLLSMIPAVYTREYRDVQAGGNFRLNGWVKGEYSNNRLPGYELNLAVEDGNFRYPKLPEAVKDIKIDLTLRNANGHEDSLYLDLRRAHLVFGQDPVDLTLVYHHPVSAPYINAMVKGRIDLQKMQRFVPLDPGTTLAGIVDADLFARGSLSAMEKGSGALEAGGYLGIEGLAYQAKELPAAIRNGRMKVLVRNEGGNADQTNIDIKSGHIEIGPDPIDFELSLSRPMTDINFSGNMNARMDLANAAAYAQLSPGTKLSGRMATALAFEGSRKAYDEKRYDDIHVNGTMGLDDMRYVSGDYPDGLSVSAARLSFSNDQVELQDCRAGYKGSQVSAKGKLQDYIGYASEKGTLKGMLAVQADKVNLNDWMGAGTATTETAADTAVFRVPERIDLQLNAGVDELVYDKVTYANLRGSLILRNGQVILKDIRTDALDGQITMNGTYDTRDERRPPLVSMDYAMKNIDVQKTFYAFNTVQKLMPVGQFISGRMHSSMKFNGELGADMMPVLTSLEGDGSLLLVEGVLRKFAPVEKIATDLGVTGLEEISIRDIKNYVRISGGKLLVKPFQVNLAGIKAEIGGTQGIDQQMDYLVAMQVPRSMMGEKGNALIGQLTEQANMKGVPVSLPENVPVHARIGGTVLKPVVSIDLKQSATGVTEAFKAQASSFVAEKKDSLKQVASATGKTLKDSARVMRDQAVQGYKTELISKLKGNSDSTGDNRSTTERLKTTAGESVKGALNGLFRKKKSGS